MTAFVPTEMRCPACLGSLAAVESPTLRCPDCRTSYRAGAVAGSLSFGAYESTFAHEVDEFYGAELVEALLACPAGSCSERVITSFARSRRALLGNPVDEGRADVARTLIADGAVVLDVGCGLGTFATAMARSASHVFALDRSPARVAITAARARCEALVNVTAIHSDGADLPLGDGTCDFVTLVGVLEWVGVGSRGPREAIARQRDVLREIHRVLKPGGKLLVGMENRLGGHYFVARPDEHTNLRFVPLLPRPVAHKVVRARRGGAFDVPTHTRRGLTRLLRSAGLTPRFSFPFPSYSEPEVSFDGADARTGLEFYVRHVFHPVSPARRIAARVVLRVPARLAMVFAPSHWAIATKGGAPLRASAVVTGTASCTGTIKEIDFLSGQIVKSPRKDLTRAASEPLIDGWNARRWVAWPLRRRMRRRREQLLLRGVEGYVRPHAEASEAERVAAFSAADAGLELLEPQAAEAARASLTVLEFTKLLSAPLHGDLRLTNIVVADGDFAPIDSAENGRSAVAGVDALSLVCDLLGLRAGAKSYDLDCAATAFSRLREDVHFAHFLRSALGVHELQAARGIIILAVLRDVAHKGTVPGAAKFIGMCASGDFDDSLRLLGVEASSG